MSSSLAIPILPFDICSQICSHICSDGPEALFTDDEALSALISLSEVSRAWCSLARRIQYETVQVFEIVELAGLLNILRGSNYIAQHIRNFIIGDTFVDIAHMSPWRSRIEDVRLIHAAIPHLKHLTIGSLFRPDSACQVKYTKHLISNPIILPAHERLSELIVRVSFFSSPSEATSFLSAMPSLRKLSLLDISPSIIATLPAYLSSGIRELSLLERKSIDSPFRDRSDYWKHISLSRMGYESIGGTTNYSIPPLDLPPNWTLDKFCYRDLSLFAMQRIHAVLVQLATHADTTIFCRYQDRLEELNFDLHDFRHCLEVAATNLSFIGMDAFPYHAAELELEECLRKSIFGPGVSCIDVLEARRRRRRRSRQTVDGLVWDDLDSPPVVHRGIRLIPGCIL